LIDIDAKAAFADLIRSAKAAAGAAVAIILVIAGFLPANSVAELLPGTALGNTNAIYTTTVRATQIAAERQGNAAARLADVIGAGISIVGTLDRLMTAASCRIAPADGAGIAVVADGRRVDAARRRITGICRAGIVVVAIQRLVNTTCDRITGIDRTGVAIVTIDGRVLTAKDRIASVRGTRVAIIARQRDAVNTDAGSVTRRDSIADVTIVAGDALGREGIRRTVRRKTGAELFDVARSSCWAADLAGRLESAGHASAGGVTRARECARAGRGGALRSGRSHAIGRAIE
jgi:hypothetical protein